jgi:hypothetical protein
VSTRYHDFCFKVRFLEPFYCLLQFRVAALVCEISGVDEYVTLRKLRCLVVGVRDADDARLPKLLWMRGLVSHGEPYQSDMFRQDEPSQSIEMQGRFWPKLVTLGWSALASALSSSTFNLIVAHFISKLFTCISRSIRSRSHTSSPHTPRTPLISHS